MEALYHLMETSNWDSSAPARLKLVMLVYGSTKSQNKQLFGSPTEELQLRTLLAFSRLVEMEILQFVVAMIAVLFGLPMFRCQHTPPLPTVGFRKSGSGS